MLENSFNGFEEYLGVLIMMGMFLEEGVEFELEIQEWQVCQPVAIP